MKKLILPLLLSVPFLIFAQGQLEPMISFMPDSFNQNMNYSLLVPIADDTPFGSPSYPQGASHDIIIEVNGAIHSISQTVKIIPQTGFVGQAQAVFERNLTNQDSLIVCIDVDYPDDTEPSNNKACKTIYGKNPPIDLDFTLYPITLFSSNRSNADTILALEAIDSMKFTIEHTIENDDRFRVANQINVLINGIVERSIAIGTLYDRVSATLGSPPYGYDYSLFASPLFLRRTLIDNLLLPDSGWVELCIELDEPADVNSSNNVQCHNFYVFNPNLSASQTTFDDFNIWYSNGRLHVENSIDAPINLTVYDVTGKIVFRDEILTQNHPLELKSGLYILQFQTLENDTIIKKILVH